MKRNVILAGACRTPIGKFGGTLSETPATTLGSIVIAETLRRTGIPASAVDMVYMGCVIQAGQGQNVARQCAIKAGLPYEVPAVTINVVCGSGLDAVNEAARMIQNGDADIVIAGGTENMSMAPYALPKARFGYTLYNNVLVDTMINDALWDAFHDYHMITTADNICKEWNLTREEIDAFALRSQEKALKAQEQHLFDAEIVPVEIKRKKDTILFDKDESPRTTTLEKLAALKTINPEGFVTAGNASGLNDGAAAVILMSEEKAKEYSVTPMAYFESSALAGVRPDIMGIGPVAAVNKVMKKTGHVITDFDIIEANEAFAAQSLAVGRELHIDADNQLNPRGGAIALGHPVGASGCRILVTLLHEMINQDAHLGLATLCIGGGMGCATIISRPQADN